MTETPPEQTPKSFAETHCKTCQAAFVRTSTAGKTFLMCLIDQQPVFHDIASCNKFKKSSV